MTLVFWCLEAFFQQGGSHFFSRPELTCLFRREKYMSSFVFISIW